MTDTITETRVDAILARASAAAEVLRDTSPAQRAAALRASATALRTAAPGLAATAAGETGLAEARFEGEIAQAGAQFEMLAAEIEDGAYLDVRIDEADDEFVLGPRADLRRGLTPIGVALNFAASNFPFTFSVAGGDTAAALAAGCAVVVKVHEGHPRTSAEVGGLMRAALEGADLPADALTLVTGVEAGLEALRDPRVGVATFTGSTSAGRFLSRVAHERERPIPFYGELGSVNPVYLLPGAVAAIDELAAGYVGFTTWSAGQVCTKPGFVFVPDAEAFGAKVAEHVRGVAGQRLLHPGISAGYERRRDELLSWHGAREVVAGSVVRDADGNATVLPTYVATDVDALAGASDTVFDEVFGPASVIVEYDRIEDAVALSERVFPGNLVSSVFAGDDDAEVAGLVVRSAARRSGRVVWNGWPLQMSFTTAQNHGGPYPATTLDVPGATSVGAAGLARFLRPVAYQQIPDGLLPPALRDANPWGVPQRRSQPGASLTWAGGADGR